MSGQTHVLSSALVLQLEVPDYPWTVPQRAYAQYRNQPKFVDWLAIARRLGGSIQAAATAVRESYDIDKAEGVQLDIIGRIVVFPRDFIGQFVMPTTEFDLIDGGECGDELAMLSDILSRSGMRMPDDLYRLAIKSKIMKNTGDATIESIIEEMMFLVGPRFLRVNDFGNMSFSVDFIGDLSDVERWALFNIDLIQIPQGVLFLGFNDVSSIIEFDDDDHEFGDNEAMFSDTKG